MNASKVLTWDGWPTIDGMRELVAWTVWKGFHVKPAGIGTDAEKKQATQAEDPPKEPPEEESIAVLRPIERGGTQYAIVSG